MFNSWLGSTSVPLGGCKARYVGTFSSSLKTLGFESLVGSLRVVLLIVEWDGPHYGHC